MRLRIPIPFLLLLAALPASAGETDQFYAWRHPPTDSTDELNTLLNLQFTRGLEGLNKLKHRRQFPCAEATRRMFRPLRLLEHLTQRGGTRGIHLNESPADNTERIERYGPVALYRDAPWWNTLLHEAPRASIDVGETWFGLDKISHFIAEGLNFYIEYRAVLADGGTREEAFDAAMLTGIRGEEASFGRGSTGIFSFADLEADAAGFAFVRDLCDGEDPLLVFEGDEWTLREPIDITDYVTPCFDEAWQLNSFREEEWSWIKPTVVGEFCALRAARTNVQARHARYRERGCRADVTASLERLYARGLSPPREGTFIDDVCSTGDIALAPPTPPPLDPGRPDVAILRIPPYVDQWRKALNSYAEQFPIGGKKPDPDAHRVGLGVGPAFSYQTDEGLGGTMLLTLDHKHGIGEDESFDSIGGMVRLTTNGVQRYEARLRSVNLFKLPLRFDLRGGLFATVNDNFCGVGNGVTCDKDEAVDAAIDAGLVGQAFDDFVRRYYANRYTRLYANLNTWWRFRRRPVAVEVLAGLKVSQYTPGDYDDTTPYPGSLYEQVFPGGEPGRTIIPELGVFVDDRDLDASPTRGFTLGASVRGASALWGSDWTYTGVHLSGAHYQRLASRPRLIFANHLVADVLFGDAPTMEQARLPGPIEMPAFGGRFIGRGIRQHRYIGKVKVMGQSELRGDFFRLVLLRRAVDFGAALFVDGAYILPDFADPHGGVPGRGLDDPNRGNAFRVVGSGGVGLRILINDSFVARLDVAVSPFEQRPLSIAMAGGVPF
jgi:hypothetical protein